MTKTKSTKHALIMSVMALVLCFTMLLGTTFAWFTDSVTSANNIIQSGNLDIILEYYDTEDKEWKDVDGSDEILDKDALWEPGYTDVAYLRIKNNGSLALKYQLGVNIISETEGKNKENKTFKLSNYIYYDVVPGQQEVFADRDEAMTHATETKKIAEGYTTGDSLPAGSDFVYMAMVVYMPTSVGNEANHNGVDIPQIDLGINVFATQDTVESDSFNDQYDADTAVFTVEEANAMLAQNKDVTLVNCIEPNGILYIPKGYTGTLTLNSVSIASIQEGDAPATAALSEDTSEEIEASDIVILGNVVVRATEDGMSAITGTALNISGNGNLVAVASGEHAFGIGGTTTEYINIENVHIVDVKGGCVQPLFVSDLNYGKSEPEGGAAIGSGFKGAEINLTNVTVDNAQGGSKAAGIGAMYHTGVTINITDSIIKNVEGGNASAGIGGSRVSDDAAPADQHVIINIKNSTVNATGGQFGAGIGSGYDTHCGEKNGAAFITETICTINIDATSDITAQGGKYAAGVGTGYHVAGLAGNIECEVNAIAGESREKYTIAQNVGFGVVDHSREVKYLTTAPTLTYMGNVINVPAEVKRVAVTSENISSVDFTQGNAIFSLAGAFDNIDIPELGNGSVLALNNATIGDLTLGSDATITGTGTLNQVNTARNSAEPVTLTITDATLDIAGELGVRNTDNKSVLNIENSTVYFGTIFVGEHTNNHKSALTEFNVVNSMLSGEENGLGSTINVWGRSGVQAKIYDSEIYTYSRGWHQSEDANDNAITFQGATCIDVDIQRSNMHLYGARSIINVRQYGSEETNINARISESLIWSVTKSNHGENTIPVWGINEDCITDSILLFTKNVYQSTDATFKSFVYGNPVIHGDYHVTTQCQWDAPIALADGQTVTFANDANVSIYDEAAGTVKFVKNGSANVVVEDGAVIKNIGGID